MHPARFRTSLLTSLALVLVSGLSAFAADKKKDVSDKVFNKLKPEQVAFVLVTPKAYKPKKATLKRKFTKKELAKGTTQWLVIRLAPKQYSGKRATSDFKRKLPTSLLARRPQMLAVQKALKLKRLARVSFYVTKEQILVLPKAKGRYVLRRLSTFKKRIKKGVYREDKPKVKKKKG